MRQSIEGGGGHFKLKFILHNFFFLKILFEKIKFTEAYFFIYFLHNLSSK
jgi:hypothetical protein